MDQCDNPDNSPKHNYAMVPLYFKFNGAADYPLTYSNIYGPDYHHSLKKDKTSVIYITATNPCVYFSSTVFEVGSNASHDTQLGVMMSEEISNVPHLSTIDTNIVVS